MEPRYIGKKGYINNSESKQNHFLSLRKAKKINLKTKKINQDKTTEKYKIYEDSYEKNNITLFLILKKNLPF